MKKRGREEQHIAAERGKVMKDEREIKMRANNIQNKGWSLIHTHPEEKNTLLHYNSLTYDALCLGMMKGNTHRNLETASKFDLHEALKLNVSICGFNLNHFTALLINLLFHSNYNLSG